MFFDLLQLVIRGFCTENIIKKNGKVPNKPQTRLLLKKILEVPFCKSRQTYIYIYIYIYIYSSFSFSGAVRWNSLPIELRQANSLRVFRIYLNGTYVTRALVYVHVGF